MTFLLVHGAWHGAWCWKHVVPLLEAKGHRAIAIDLPGLGDDETPLEQVTLEVWNDALGAHIDAQPEPVVLVGHSRGGVNISWAAELRPDRIRSLIYVAAVLLKDGETSAVYPEMMEAIAPKLEFAEDGSSARVRPEACAETFYAQCSPEDVSFALENLRPEPFAPTSLPLRISEGAWGRIPRSYVECTEDRALPVELQRRMLAHHSGTRIATLEADHSPFFSMPERLANTLIELAST